MQPRLSTPRTLCRLVEPAEADLVLDYYRRAGGRYDPPLPDKLLQRSYWEKQAVAQQMEFTLGSACRFSVFTADEKKVIGTVALTRLTRGARYDCSLGYTIDAEYEGQGLMGEAVSAVIAYAFGPLHMHRVEASYAPDNARSAALLERLGFYRIGEIPGFLLVDGGWRSTILVSLINPKWVHPQAQV